MPLLSLEELATELSIPAQHIRELVDRHILVPYGGRARLGEPRFSPRAIQDIRKKVEMYQSEDNTA